MLPAVAAIRQPLVILLFAIQVYWVATRFFEQPQYYTWAPVQTMTHFRVQVRLGTETLTYLDSCRRYRFKFCGVDHHSPDNIFDLIEQYETTYGKNDHAEVTVQYRVNGSEVREWKHRAT